MSATNENTKTIFFTIARMNPPTPGHMKLIKELISKAAENKEKDVFVILSRTMNDENPIPCDKTSQNISKSFMLENLENSLKQNMIREYPQKSQEISQVNVHFRCIAETDFEKTPFQTLRQIVNENLREPIKFIKLFVILGMDRSSMIESISNVFLKDESIISVESTLLQRTGMEKLKSKSLDELYTENINDVEPSQYSASFVRKIVSFGPDTIEDIEQKREHLKSLDKNQLTTEQLQIQKEIKFYDDFHVIYDPYFEKEIVDKIYLSIKKGMASNTKPKRNTTSVLGKRKSLNGGRKTRKNKKKN